MQIPQHWNGDCGGLANQNAMAFYFSITFQSGTLLETGIQLESGILFFNHLPMWHSIRDWHSTGEWHSNRENTMWRFAVIYSLAKSIGRFPGISYASTWTCDKLNSPREIERTFPLFHAVQYYFEFQC
uniref:Uncharacterized protein n=2 Tax=Meloidogyne incognita TaxID=6306 RepID=A0A914LWH1_MELIC